MARQIDTGKSVIIAVIVLALLICGIYLLIGGFSPDQKSENPKPTKNGVLQHPNLGGD